jgi:hypothetical protein
LIVRCREIAGVAIPCLIVSAIAGLRIRRATPYVNVGVGHPTYFLGDSSFLMRIFLAGIMQGSHLGATLHNQDYRGRLRQLLTAHLPAAQLYDPLADHADSLSYDDARGREVFFHHNRMCGEVDVVLAFVPQASMGTAIEMWEAYRHGRIVVSISPLEHNWAVKFLSHVLYRDVEEFEHALATGHLAERLAVISNQPRRQATDH